MTDHAPDDAPLLDRAHLSMMTGEDTDLAVEVLGIFSQQAEMWVRLLDPRRTAETWADAAHSLKGAALGIGATRLARVCEITERLGRSGKASPTAAAVSINDVRDVLGATLEAVAAASYELTSSGSFIRS